MIGHEVDFGTDDFNRPKVLSLKESYCRLLLNVLILKPGNLPSLPHIGINIKQYLYKLESEIDIAELKDKIYEQCSELLPLILSDEMRIFITKQENQDILVLYFPIAVDMEQEAILYAFTQNEKGELRYNTMFQPLRPL